MPNITLNNRSITELESFAIGVGDSAFQEHVNELRSLAKTGLGQTPEQKLVLNIKNAWAELYGPSVTSWPANLQDALSSIEAGLGLHSLNSNLISAFQSLRLEYDTTPAFEAGIAVVAQIIGQNGPMNRATTELAEQSLDSLALARDMALQLQAATQSSFIPEGAAQAGLSFIKSPFALMVPMWIAGGSGRLATTGILRIGEALGLAGEAGTAISFAASVIAEGGAFVGSNNVIQYVAQDFSPPSESWNAKAFRYEESFLTQTAASTIFFLGLKGFGAIGRFAAAFVPATATGSAIAKAIGHASAIGGLASMEEIQAAAGIAPASSKSFYESLVRATFLHGVVQATNGIINLKGTESRTNGIFSRAQELVETLRERVAPETVVLTANGRGYSLRELGDIFRPFAMFAADEKGSGKKGGTTTKMTQATPEQKPADEKLVRAGSREITDLLLGGFFLLKPFRFIANAVTGLIAAARYADGRSKAKKGDVKGAIKYLQKTIDLFELMGGPVLAAQTYYEMGEVIMTSNMVDKEKANEAFAAFGKAYDIYVERYESTKEQKYWHNARFCRERRADAGRLAITKNSVIEQMDDLLTGKDGKQEAALEDMDKFVTSTATFWLHPNNREKARAEVFGDPIAPGKLPLGLLVVRLKNIGRHDLAIRLLRKPAKEERTPERLKELEQARSAVRRYFPIVDKAVVMRWLENNGFLGNDLVENLALIEKAQLAVEQVAQQFLVGKQGAETEEDRRLKKLFLKAEKDGSQSVTEKCVARVLSDLFKEGKEKAVERTEMLALPGRSVFDERLLAEEGLQERIPSASILIRLINIAGTDRSKIDQWYKDVTGLIASSLFPQEYFVGGRLTEAGVEYAVKQVTGHNVTVNPLAERRGGGEVVQEVEEHVAVAAANPKEALELLIKNGKLRFIPRLKKMVEAEWRIFLHKIMSMQKEAELEKRPEKIVYTKLADGRFDFNAIRLELAVEYAELFTQVRDIMNRKYDDVSQLDESEQTQIFDAVTGIIQREVFESRFDSHGKLRVGVVKKAYEEIYLKGRARDIDYTPRAGGDEEMDVGVEESTDQVDVEKILKGPEKGDK